MAIPEPNQSPPFVAPSPVDTDYGALTISPRAPEIRFAAIGDAWRLLQQQSTPWVLGYLLVGFITLAVGIAIQLPFGLGSYYADLLSSHGMHHGRVSPYAPRIEIPVKVITSTLSLFMTGCLVKMGTRQLRGYAISLADCFTVGSVAAQLLLASFILAVIDTIGIKLFYIPYLIAHGVLMFTLPLIVDQRLPALDAIRLSWNTLRPQMLMSILFHTAAVIISLLGFLLCCVGVIFTAPLATLSVLVVYRDFFLHLPEPQPQYSHTDPGGGPPIPEPF